MSLEAQSPTLHEVRSHWIETEYPRGGELSKEELYPECTAEWRGEEIDFTMQARRYRASGESGPFWTGWMVSFYHGPERLTETARAALKRAATPLVNTWLSGPEYAPSRRQAIRYMLVRLIRDEHLSATNPAQELMRHGHELDPKDDADLAEAIYHQTQMLKLLDGEKVSS